MARRRSKSKSSLRYPRQRKIITRFASKPLLSVRSRPASAILRSARLYLQDAREFSPYLSTVRPAQTVSGRPTVITVAPPPTPLRKAGFSFSNPRSVTTCVRRGVRREVIFAKGKGGRGYKKPKRLTPYSKVKC